MTISLPNPFKFFNLSYTESAVSDMRRSFKERFNRINYYLLKGSFIKLPVLVVNQRIRRAFVTIGALEITFCIT